MKAVRFHEYGDASVLRVEDVPKPEPGPDEVLIRTAAAGVNPIDWKVRAGMMRAMRPYRLPLIPGWDVAGIVEQAGPLARFHPGDAVFGRTDAMRDGTYAEFVCARSQEIARAPASLPLIHAAAVPLAALTAWMCLFDKLDLRAGEHVLIHAASGGVGGFAVQLAHLAGLRVTATCSGANAAYVRSLGADQVIDHTAEDFAQRLSGLDAVLDAVGGEVLARSYGVLRRGGRLVSIADSPDEARAASLGITAQRAALGVNGARCADLAALIDAGKLKVEIAREFPLEQAREAHELSETRRVRGKIILRMA
jgi:NADPH:quinone reductase-like Zn-dependent oxidoreductase